MVGLSDGWRFVHRRASWKVFLTWAKSMHVTETSGSTASITVLSSAFDNIWAAKLKNQLLNHFRNITREMFANLNYLINSCMAFALQNKSQFAWHKKIKFLNKIYSTNIGVKSNIPVDANLIHCPQLSSLSAAPEGQCQNYKHQIFHWAARYGHTLDQCSQLYQEHKLMHESLQ